MSLTMSMAWRNLGRNRRRTTITGLSITLAVGLGIWVYGWIDGMNAEMVRALTRLDLGHAQIHHPDYPRRKALRYSFDPTRWEKTVLANVEGAKGMAKRVYTGALLSLSSDGKRRSTGAQLVGVDPTNEPKVTELHERVIRGSYLPAAATPWLEGRQLTDQEKETDRDSSRRYEDQLTAGLFDEEPTAAPSDTSAERARTQKIQNILNPRPDHPPNILLGKSLARVLGAKVGDKIHLSTADRHGDPASEYFVVVGLFETGTQQLDRTRAYLHLEDLQRFVRMDDRVHEVSILLDDAYRADQVVGAIGAQPGLENLLVRSWLQIRPDIRSMLKLNEVATGIMLGIFLFMVALIVVNTMLMAVFERTRELGMLKAIGSTPWRVVRLIVAETFLLALVASFLGVGLGLALDAYMIYVGLDFSGLIEGSYSMGGVGMSTTMYGKITAQGVMVPFVSSVVLSVLGAFYPAFRAARLRPAHSMREA